MQAFSYQQPFQIQQQRSPHFIQSPVSPQIIHSDGLNSHFINSSQLSRRSMFSSVPPTSHSQPPPIVMQAYQQQQQQQQQLIASPLPKIGLNSTLNTSLNSSSLSILNGQPGVSTIPQQPHQIGNQLTPYSPANSIKSSSSCKHMSLNKTLGNQLTQSDLHESDKLQKQGIQISKQQTEIKKLKDELSTTKSACASTQKHNDELVQKIKVLIRENEKIQQKEQEDAEKSIQENIQKNSPNIQMLLLENKRFQGVIRDLESKTKQLVLENEKQLVLLKQAYQQNSQKEQNNLNSSNKNEDQKEGRGSVKSDRGESISQLQTKIDLQKIEIKNYQNITNSWEKKIDMLLAENEKLQQIVKDKIKQAENLQKENTVLGSKIQAIESEGEKMKGMLAHQSLQEQQVNQIEINFQAILEENKRISSLYQDKTSEIEVLKQKIEEKEKIASIDQNEEQKKIKDLTRQVDNLTEQVGNLTAQKRNMQEQIQSASLDQTQLRYSFKIEKKQLDTQVLEFKEKHESVSEQLKGMKKIQENNENLIQELSDLKKEGLKKEDFNLKCHFLQKEKFDLEQRIQLYEAAWELERKEMASKHRLENEETNEIKKKLDFNLKRVSIAQQELKHAEGQIFLKVGEINLLKMKLGEAEEEVVRNRNEIDELKKKILENKEEISRKQLQIEKQQHQLTFASSEIDSKTHELEASIELQKESKLLLENEYKNISQARSEISKFQTENQKLQTENYSLLLNSQRLAKQISSLDEKIEELSLLLPKERKIEEHAVNEDQQKIGETLQKLMKLEKEFLQKLK